MDTNGPRISSFIGKREKRGEGSAWTLCSGRPSKVGRREERGEGSAWTLCSGRPSKVGKREKRREGSAWSLCSGRPLSTADAVGLGAERESYTGRAAEATRGRAIHALLSSL